MTASTEKKGGSKLVQAIIKTSLDIGKLAKADHNKFDKYNFVSIDKFLEATGPALASNGLIIQMEEDECERIERGGKPWLKFSYEFTVMHSSGESLPSCRRTVHVPFTGPQSTGSAQSYALKQFMRGLFQITTGDKDDADFNQSDNSIETVTSEEVDEIAALIDEAGLTDEYVLKRARAKAFSEISASLYRSKSGMRNFLLETIESKEEEVA